MNLALKNIILSETGKVPKASQLVKLTKLSYSTVVDALKRPINKTSFGVTTKILYSLSISVDEVTSRYLQGTDPVEEEEKFLNQTNLKTLSIMGIKFSTRENYWKTRDSILNSIYEGYHPLKRDVEDAYQQLEQKVSTQKMISNLLHEYRAQK